MHSFIHFIMGPMVWISLSLFLAGVIFKFARLVRLIDRKEKFIYTYFSFKYGLRSILAWLVPFLPASTRKKPVFFAISYIFHLLLFVVPIFLLAHVALLEETMNWSWATINEPLADALTLVIIFALIFFAIRRIVLPEISFLTKTSDFLFILIVTLPFATGFLAYHQFVAYQWMTIVHIISGELMIILIPFTRFFHMFMAPFTRAYTGSEFGAVRHAKDW